MDRTRLSFRARCIREIRSFFEDLGYLEVDTPVTAGGVIPEPTIELMETAVHRIENESGGRLYLLPSPEIYMKRLVAAGAGSIFQFSRCFRDRESESKLHSHEFLMLEWYTVDAGYLDSLERTEELLKTLAGNCGVPAHIKSFLSAGIRKMTIEEVFREFAGIELSLCGETGALREAAAKSNIDVDFNLEWDELFHLILVAAVEPKLPMDRPVVLLDYPSRVGCLARQKEGTPWRERWELYLQGIETANCFTEMTSAKDVAAHFEKETKMMGTLEMVDHSFPGIYENGHPKCSGVALGIDRLIMVLAGADSISEVMPFPEISGG